MLTSRAMLVELNISVWTARKIDRRVSEEVDIDKGTRARAGNYHKNLLAGTDLLADIGKLASEIRNYHYHNTLPWNDSGARLLPTASFMAYNTWMHEAKQKFEGDVAWFIQQYPSLVTGAAFVMGKLFDRNEYPDPDEVASKFKFKFGYSPVPEAGDFRVDVAEELRTELQEQYEGFFTDRINTAMGDAWQRLYDTLTHMSERLDWTQDNPKRIFNSMLENANELCDLLTSLNVTQDAAMEQARSSLQQAINGVTTESIKTDQLVRDDLRAKVDAITSAMNF